jgi:glyoxylase-like metal-dependent hydrolase (beta-lactamase superfamily II)
MPTGPWRGGAVGAAALCVLAPNPSPMTLDGTNTWVVGAPGGPCVVVDPGPDDGGHLDAVLDAVRARDGRVRAVLLTHGHPDHSAGAAGFAARAGVGVRALDPAHRLGDEGLDAGDVVEVAGARLEVVGTPGHTSDSLCFVLAADGEGPAVLTGDTVLGRGTTVVAHPDGRLAAYLDSLRRLEALAAAAGVTAVLPGHGPVLGLPDVAPLDVVRFYLAHRAERLEQVRAAVAQGAVTARDVVERVYTDVPRSVWPAAELSVAAQLEFLRS